MTKMTPISDAVTLFAQTAAPGGGQQLMSVLPIVLMMAGFWFLVIAPQRKKQKELQRAIDALQTGDEVITSGGIYGEITNRRDDRFIIRIAENTKVEVGKAYIQAVVSKTTPTKSK
jgi:preprotein translocase subunit YajC